ncbi:MAG: DUF58 domain-containing protein [Candidatus Polarisedimenticolaceae bacterium]|nr:DUF58 domain-containing protein [Candidatus Polarisedimenticolaceae bacterium]
MKFKPNLLRPDLFRGSLMLNWFHNKIQQPTAGVVASSSSTQATTEELIQLRLHVKGLKLRGRQMATSVISGTHHSRFRGRGMDYLESRCYQPGDDIRNMDWRVTARTGTPHTKIYHEERERPVVVVVDLGPTMFFGTRNCLKSVQACRAAAMLGWATITQGDRIGALIFNGKHQELQPSGGQRGVLRLIRHLNQSSDPSKGLANSADNNGLNHALKRLHRVARPGSLIFIISDFYNLNDDTDQQLMRLRQHNDLIALQITDPLELAPPPAGSYAITDGHNSGWLDSRQTSTQAWLPHYHQRINEVIERRAMPLLQLSTTDEISSKLRQFFNSSKQGKRR